MFLSLATESGLEITPYILGIAISSVVSGQLLSRSRSVSYRTTCATGAVLITIGSGLIILWNERSGKPVQIASMGAAGIGVGIRLSQMDFFFLPSFLLLTLDCIFSYYAGHVTMRT